MQSKLPFYCCYLNLCKESCVSQKLIEHPIREKKGCRFKFPVVNKDILLTLICLCLGVIILYTRIEGIVALQGILYGSHTNVHEWYGPSTKVLCFVKHTLINAVDCLKSKWLRMQNKNKKDKKRRGKCIQSWALFQINCCSHFPQLLRYLRKWWPGRWIRRPTTFH